MATTSGSFSFFDRNPNSLSPLLDQQQLKNTYLTNIDESSLPGSNSLTTVDDFIISLNGLGVPGPLTLYTSFAEARSLGKGPKFPVYAGRLLDPSNLHDTLLEIMALRHADLKSHRNIVRLLGWGFEELWHQAPLLVLELAISDLHYIFNILDNKNIKMTSGLGQQLSIDVGQDLDAIHEAGFIHGDIKPQKVLVFENNSEKVPMVAELADFGLSVGEIKASSSDLVEVVGMSSDWCAPEIKVGSKLSTSQLIKADNFSYGLMVLSVNCLRALPPATKDLHTALEVLRSCPDMPASLFSLLETAIALLLEGNPQQRPLKVGDILKDKSAHCVSWEENEAEYRLASHNQQLKHAQKPFDHPWRLPSLSPFLVLGQEKSHQQYKTWMTGPQLFAMFLLQSYTGAQHADKSSQMEMLLAAAGKGHIPAQAVVSRVYRSYNMPHDDDKTFLFNGASSGCLLAMRELEVMDPALAIKAQAKFRSSTGYNQLYSPVGTANAYSIDFVDADGNKSIHHISARGSFWTLRKFLLLHKTIIDINARNIRGETALYKACLTGCSKAVRELCKYGAKASIPTLLKITCLHWLFNFPTTQIEQIATVFVNAGADINAFASPVPRLMNLHFPFSWPSGTPLHFATCTSNTTAARTLLKLGARAGLRDGRDPFLSDKNVRRRHHHDSAAGGELSEPNKSCLGMSSVDLAAAIHDTTVLELIKMYNTEDDPFSPDEEGYTPFHRLSYLRVVQTYHSLRFWYSAFTRSPDDVKERLIKTISVLQSIGSDINQLTNTPRRPALRGVSRLSPLQIAVSKSDHEAVAALLECGADPNKVNRDGRSPLTLLPGAGDPCTTLESLPNIVGLLLKYHAKVNHKSWDGVTPLGAAIASGSMPSIKALIDAGADLSHFESGVNIIAKLMDQSSHLRFIQPPHATPLAEAETRERDIVQILKKIE